VSRPVAVRIPKWFRDHSKWSRDHMPDTVAGRRADGADGADASTEGEPG
jgi:hypothetical protein